MFTVDSVSISSDPSSQTVAAGSNATFAAAAIGADQTPRVQWEVSTNNGTSFSVLTGATSTSYSFSATAADNGDEYEVVFTAGLATATTSTATLTVDSVTITTHPTSQTVAAGNSVTFTVAASGTPAPTVQWEVSTNNGTSFSVITGATSTS